MWKCGRWSANLYSLTIPLPLTSQLDAPRAGTLSQDAVMSMYRQAVRMAGPQPLGNMGKAFAAAILDHGFVGIATHLQLVSGHRRQQGKGEEIL